MSLQAVLGQNKAQEGTDFLELPGRKACMFAGMAIGGVVGFSAATYHIFSEIGARDEAMAEIYQNSGAPLGALLGGLALGMGSGAVIGNQVARLWSLETDRSNKSDASLLATRSDKISQIPRKGRMQGWFRVVKRK